MILLPLCCSYLCPVNDSLDDILGESGDEEEQDAVVSQVLDEIGIEISGKVCAPPLTAELVPLVVAVSYTHLRAPRD